MKTLYVLPDSELISLYMKGDCTAFNTLIIRHKEKIYSVIYLMVKDTHAAEDIFQDLFVKIIDAFNSGRYKDDGRFLSWALRIAHNLCIDHFRLKKRNPVMKCKPVDDVIEFENLKEYGVDHKMINHEIAEDIRTLMNKLPDDQREVVILRHYANLSFKEIASLTNCSINTVLGRMRYGILNLRKYKGNYQLT